MQEIVIAPAGEGRTFEGLGAVSAGGSSRLLIDYPEPQRAEILDLLFTPGVGAGLQHLKVEIGGDTNSTDGAEPSHARSRDERDYHRGWEWWLMREARQRNPEIMLEALCWGAPGWLGDGRYHSQDTADYIADFVVGAREHHGVEIDVVGGWNEMTYDVEWFKLLKRTLRDRGLDTQLAVADCGWEPILSDLESDPELFAATDVVGSHYPQWFLSPERARVCGKRLWSSEEGPWDKVGQAQFGEWPGARELARSYNRNYVLGRMTKTLIWSPIAAYYDNLMIPGCGLMRANEPWSGHYRAQPALWVTAHTTRFARPGWRYLDAACQMLDGGGSCVTLVSPDGADVTIVLETMGASDVQRVALADAPRLLHGWITTAERTLEPIGPVEGVLELPPEAVLTVSTLDGEVPPRPTPPASAPFPLPYQDELATSPGHMPRYLSDQEGAFELVDGQLEQVIVEPPIPWTANWVTPSAPAPTPADQKGRPFTIVGDGGWRDYTVSVDACPAAGGEAALLGRVWGCPPTVVTMPARYELRIDADGNWRLLRIAPWEEPADVVLASGAAPAAAGAWRRLSLTFDGRRIGAAVDGEHVADVEDARIEHGSVGLGSDWSRARFRRLVVS